MPGEILMVMGELYVEQTYADPSGATAGFNSGIYLGESVLYSDVDKGNEYEITERNGQNMDLQELLIYETHTKVGTFLATSANVDDQRLYVNFFAKMLHDSA